MSKIFISYRRDDSAGYAQAIYSQLVQHFSKDRVFMDVDTMEPGVDFVRVIETAVGECEVLLALIGKRWANVGSDARSRLDDPEDFVRLEISTALARDVRVIPVLVDGMTMPSGETMPTSLKALSRRHAIEISNTRFNFDVERLITTVRKVLDETEAKRKPDEESQRRIQEGKNRILQEVEKGFSAHTARPEDRVPRESYWSSRRPRLLTALWVGLAGAIFGGAAEMMIYANDERLGIHGPSLLVTTVGGGLVAGPLWAVAGAVAGHRRLPLVSALSTSLVVLVGWIAIFGTYADVMGAAVLLGWPVGGIIGATIGDQILKMRGDSQQPA